MEITNSRVSPLKNLALAVAAGTGAVLGAGSAAQAHTPPTDIGTVISNLQAANNNLAEARTSYEKAQQAVQSDPYASKKWDVLTAQQQFDSANDTLWAVQNAVPDTFLATRFEALDLVRDSQASAAIAARHLTFAQEQLPSQGDDAKSEAEISMLRSAQEARDAAEYNQMKAKAKWLDYRLDAAELAIDRDPTAKKLEGILYPSNPFVGYPFYDKQQVDFYTGLQQRAKAAGYPYVSDELQVRIDRWEKQLSADTAGQTKIQAQYEDFIKTVPPEQLKAALAKEAASDAISAVEIPLFIETNRHDIGTVVEQIRTERNREMAAVSQDPVAALYLDILNAQQSIAAATFGSGFLDGLFAGIPIPNVSTFLSPDPFLNPLGSIQDELYRARLGLQAATNKFNVAASLLSPPQSFLSAGILASQEKATRLANSERDFTKEALLQLYLALAAKVVELECSKEPKPQEVREAVRQRDESYDVLAFVEEAQLRQ